MVAIVLLSSGAAFADPAPSTASWRVRSFYEHPVGTHNAIVENVSGEVRPLEVDTLKNAEDGSPVHVWWTRANPELVETGKLAWLRFALKRAKSRPDAVTLALKSGDVLALQPGGAPLLPVYCVHDTNALYTYWRNDGAMPVTLEGLAPFDSADETGDTSTTIAPGETGLRVIRPHASTAPSGADTIFTMRTSAGPAWTAAPVFDAASFTLRWEHEQPDLLVCPTHQHGPWDVVGSKIFSWEAAVAAPPATVHFCRNRLPDGLVAFAACAPRAVVNLQAANLTRGAEAPWPGWFDIAALVKSATEPGAFVTLIEDASLFGGAYGQLASPEDPPLRDAEIRPLVYLSLAAGAKGLLFRPSARAPDATAFEPVTSTTPNIPREDERTRFDIVRDEVRPLQSLLAISAPLTPVESFDTDTHWIRVLRCGADSLFVVAYAKPNEGVQPGTSATISLRAPTDMPTFSQWKPYPGSEGQPVSSEDHSYTWTTQCDKDGLAVGFLTP